MCVCVNCQRRARHWHWRCRESLGPGWQPLASLQRGLATKPRRWRRLTSQGDILRRRMAQASLLSRASCQPGQQLKLSHRRQQQQQQHRPHGTVPLDKQTSSLSSLASSSRHWLASGEGENLKRPRAGSPAGPLHCGLPFGGNKRHELYQAKLANDETQHCERGHSQRRPLLFLFDRSFIRSFAGSHSPIWLAC